MCLTDLVEKFKAGHSAFTKSEKNGKIYFNFNEWLNDAPNEHGHHSNYQLQSKKEHREAEGKTYFGNGKISENQGAAITDTDKSSMDLGGTAAAVDDLPF